MNPLRQSLLNSLDRAAGSMMASMPIDFQLAYGKTCTNTAVFHGGCGHVSPGGEIKRVMDCWLCAYQPGTPCQPLAGCLDSTSVCRLCRLEEQSKDVTDEERSKEEEFQRGINRERELNARRREEREYERRRLSAIRHRERELKVKCNDKRK